MQYVFFDKDITGNSVQRDLGQRESKDPEAAEFSRIFVLKVTLQSVGLL